MNVKIEKAAEIGFCFGVKRALRMMEKAARQHGKLESLGAVVHNEQVVQQLAASGIEVKDNLASLQGPVVAISSHGVSPEIKSALSQKDFHIIDTTCPDVRRAQLAANKLSEEDYFVIIYGDASHPEVKGILGWANNKGIAILSAEDYRPHLKLHPKIGIIAQTTQVSENFVLFIKDILDIACSRYTEICIIDTLCQRTRKRQMLSRDLAEKSDLILVVGGKTSANTKRLYEICANETETHLIGKIDDIQESWLKGKQYIGVTSGTSTPEQIIDEIIVHLEKRLNQPAINSDRLD